MKITKVLKKSLFIISITILSTLFLSCKKNEKCIIKGKVIGVSKKAIVLVKAGESYRYEGVDIPIKSDSTFYYEFELDHPESCKLYFENIRTKRGGRGMTFFLEPGEINITVYPEKEFSKNIVSGGKFNEEYQKFAQEVKEFNSQYYSEFDSLNRIEDSLMTNKLYYTSDSEQEPDKIDSFSLEEKEIIDYINSNSCDERMDYSKEVLNIYTRRRAILKATNNWLFNKINNDRSIVSYYFLVDNIKYFKQYIEDSLIKESYKNFANKYPNHPYNDYAKNQLIPFGVGEKYIDFIAPDINGNLVTISEEIDNKIAIIDLWASWCAPCIQRSKQLIPIYTEFKNKDFTIIGLANEYKSTIAFQERIEKDKYPWTNLYDLDEQYKIAEKYDGGLKTVLIDKDGTILAINPSPEDIKQILVEKLKI
jgi:thiol-disulfide isomerase/thioredoxin